MNKKFSTLMATALVAGSMAANAAGPQRPYEFRAMNVEAAPTRANSTINHIEADKWYQLRTSFSRYDNYRPNRPHRNEKGVLAQFRNPQTGEVYLRVVNEGDAPLVNSLWRIEYTKDDGVGGGKYRFINKETNVALMFDQTFANTSDAKNMFSSVMVNGCVNEWEWYNNNSQASKFDEVAPYAYFAGQEYVMIMRIEQNGFVSAYKGKASDLLDNHAVADIPRALKIQPVVASAIELKASDFNSMIDYNKPSWAQEGEFAFYEPNGNLFNQVKMNPEASTMKGDMKYKAENDRQMLRQFFEFSLQQEGVNPAGFEDLLTAVIQAKTAYDDALTAKINAENALSEVEGTVFTSAEAIERQQTLVDDAKVGYDAAKTKALAIAETVKTAFANGRFGAYTLSSCATTTNNYASRQSAYDQALGAYNNDKTIENALALFNAGSDLLTQGYRRANSGAGANYQNLLNTYSAYNNYTASDDQAVELYNTYLAVLEGYNDAYIIAVQLENETRKDYQAAVETADAKKEAWSQAIATLKSATSTYAKTHYLVENNFMRLKYMDEASNSYLMVDTAFWQKQTTPSSAQLVLSHKVPVASDNKAIAARYYHKLTYYPTQDSLVVEPLNASKISDADYAAGKNWADTYVGTHFVYSNNMPGLASQASNSWTNDKKIAVKLEELNTSKWCLTAAVVNPVQDSPLKTRIAFNNPYGYLTRTTLDEGLYFIKSTNRDRFLVDNFNGKLMYDVEEKGIQDYNQMPATMWVVEKLGCEGGDLVIVRNREYGNAANWIFAGQLYTAEDGTLFTINNWYGAKYNGLTAELMLTGNKLYLTDNYEFIPVTDETALTSKHHGYGFMDPETLKYTNYAFRYNHNNGDKYLNIDADNLLKVTTDANVYYELDTVYPYNINEFENLSINNFGYGANVVYNKATGAKLPQLERQRYTLKVKDVNLIDNDTTYVAMNTTIGANGYYIAKGIKEIREGGATLSSFYLKNDQIDDTETCYALIDTRSNYATDYYWNGYRRATVIDGNAHVEYNTLNNYPNSAVSAFALEVNNRPLYRSIPETGVNFFRTVGGVDQKLFHDATNQSNASAVIDGFGYLGLAQEKMTATDDDKELFVEPLRAYSSRMPQYMLAIEKDTVADGLWCNTNTHGYFKNIEDAEASKEDVTHVVFYNGYTAGRFLVNLQDSVVVGSHAYHHPDKFTYNGYAVRLGFIEGVHMVITAENAAKINAFLGANTVKAGEFFYVPVNGKTLADLENDKGYLIPGKLFDPANTKCNEYTPATHNSWSFSFRLIDDTTPEVFYIESYLKGHSAIGSWTGSWVKIYNNCPVVNFIDGEHSSVEGVGLKADNVTDAQEFHLASTSEEGPGVANEEVSVSSVKVTAKEGAINIVGAANKKVNVVNVLGQTIASQILSSDNETISAPAGVVVVSVEGEETVKAIVK